MFGTCVRSEDYCGHRFIDTIFDLPQSEANDTIMSYKDKRETLITRAMELNKRQDVHPNSLRR